MLLANLLEIWCVLSVLKRGPCVSKLPLARELRRCSLASFSQPHPSHGHMWTSCSWMVCSLAAILLPFPPACSFLHLGLSEAGLSLSISAWIGSCPRGGHGVWTEQSWPPEVCGFQYLRLILNEDIQFLNYFEFLILLNNLKGLIIFKGY